MKPSLLVLLLPAILTGCLEFEQQTLSYHFDKESDSLRIFQDYQGIFGADAKGKAEKPLSSEEVTQLDSVLKGQRTFFFNNWIFEYNRAIVEEALASSKTPEKRAERNLPPGGFAKIEKLLNLLLENVRVENGSFYLDAQKQLCGVQSVTLSNCSPVFESINECMPFLMQEQAEEEETSPANREAIAKFTKASHKCVQLNGNALTMRWPISKASFDEEFGSKSENPDWLAEVKKEGLSITFANDVATLELGEPDDEITSLTLPFSNKEYTPNAIEPARKQHVVKDSFDPVAAAKQFLLQKGKK